MIIYAIITQASIGKLFMAGVLPGILLVLLFIAVILIWGKLKPKAVGSSDKVKFTWRVIPAIAVRIWPVGLLAVIIMGGIWGGIFSPTEAGAIGAFAAFVLLLLGED
jgi:TRAP-type C4-dicarboxylate transport system permease large subunit